MEAFGTITLVIDSDDRLDDAFDILFNKVSKKKKVVTILGL